MIKNAFLRLTGIFITICFHLLCSAVFIQETYPQNNIIIDSPNKKKILIINSYHPGYIWSDEILKGIHEGLEDSPLDIEIFLEYLDTKRFPDLKHLDALAEAMEIRNRHITYDLIITSDNNAFDFATSHRERLFPGKPIVFCGLNDFQFSDVKEIENITGINEAVEIKSTIDLALDIHGDTQNLLFITSTIRKTEKRNYDHLQKIIPAYANRYTIRIISNKSTEEIETITSKTSNKSLVFILSHPVNKGIYEYVAADVFSRRLAAASAAPVYSPWDIYIGTGVVGGNIITGKKQGEVVIDMAIRILSGTSIDTIPIIINTPTSPMFDYKAMKRFDISIKNIPPGSIIINKKISFYQQYKLYVWIAIAVVLFLSAMIILLSLLLRKSLILEKLLKIKQVKLVKLLSEKELLIKEVHHRVKNNLQNITAIIYLKKSQISDEATITIFDEINERIYSMGLIHNLLYKSEDISQINFKDYIDKLSDFLEKSYMLKERHIEYAWNVKSVSLKLNIAIPCGLLINEILTNAMKHAFVNKKTGKIIMDFKIDEKYAPDTNNFILSICDNGSGLPEDFRQKNTVGMVLIPELVKQLGGTYSISNNKGTIFRLYFKQEA